MDGLLWKIGLRKVLSLPALWAKATNKSFSFSAWVIFKISDWVSTISSLQCIAGCDFRLIFITFGEKVVLYRAIELLGFRIQSDLVYRLSRISETKRLNYWFCWDSTRLRTIPNRIYWDVMRLCRILLLIDEMYLKRNVNLHQFSGYLIRYGTRTAD